MKALLSSALIGLLALQMSCTTGNVSKIASNDQAIQNQANLPTPEVAVPGVYKFT